MSAYPDRHTPGAMAPASTFTRPVPALDDDGLGGILDDTAGIHAGIDMIRDGIRLLALDRLTVRQTQNVLAALAAADPNLTHAIGALVERLTNPDTNPALDALDPQTVKDVQVLGEQYRQHTVEYGPHDLAGEAIARIEGI